MREREPQNKNGALEMKIRQHQRTINLCILAIVLLILNIIALQFKMEEIIDILDKTTRIIVEEVQVP